jgi:hypothetical protein
MMINNLSGMIFTFKGCRDIRFRQSEVMIMHGPCTLEAEVTDASWRRPEIWPSPPPPNHLVPSTHRNSLIHLQKFSSAKLHLQNNNVFFSSHYYISHVGYNCGFTHMSAHLFVFISKNLLPFEHITIKCRAANF